MRIHSWQRLLDSLELRHWSFPGEAWTEATSEDNGAGGFDEDSVAQNAPHGTHVLRRSKRHDLAEKVARPSEGADATPTENLYDGSVFTRHALRLRSRQTRSENWCSGLHFDAETFFVC